MSKYTEYARLKQEWIDAHPNATPAQYQESMQEIARKCGI